MSQFFTIVNQDFLIDRSTNYAVNTAAGSVTATLPAIRMVGIGQSLTVINLGKNKLTIITEDSTIDGASQIVVTDSCSLVNLGSHWATYNFIKQPAEAPVVTPVSKPKLLKQQEVLDVSSQQT